LSVELTFILYEPEEPLKEGIDTQVPAVLSILVQVHPVNVVVNVRAVHDVSLNAKSENAVSTDPLPGV